jgi:hypothetical protein
MIQSWCSEILNSRVFDQTYKFYTPNLSNHIYMIAYHALIHKFQPNPDYLNQLVELTKNIEGGRNK